MTDPHVGSGVHIGLLDLAVAAAVGVYAGLVLAIWAGTRRTVVTIPDSPAPLIDRKTSNRKD